MTVPDPRPEPTATEVADTLPGDSPSPDRPAESRRLGAYEIEAEIARGGMGVVYRARHLETRRVVALKLIRRAEASPELEERFLLESRIAAQLDHPGIVKIYDAGAVEGQRYLAMEFVEGRTMAALLAAGELGRRDLVALLARVCRAVHHAHMRGVIHRDLKPANVLVDASGTPRVADFGLAKVVTEDSSEARRLTASGAMLGTPVYMSPEQASGDPGAVDLRSDVFSLGVMLYEALAGRLPFEGENLIQLLSRITAAEFPPLPPGVPSELELVARKAMERTPARRYATAGDLAADLEAWLEGRPVSARGDSWTYRAGKWIGRHPTFAALAGLLLLVDAGGALHLSTRAATVRIDAAEDRVVVLVDGEVAGESTPTAPLTLSLRPGGHWIRIEGERAFPVEQRLELSAGEFQRIPVRLPSRLGVLEISTRPPGAKVWVVEAGGGESVLIEETRGTAQLLEGEHEIVVRKEGHREVRRTVEVEPGGSLARIEVELPEEGRGHLEVASDLERVLLEVVDDRGRRSTHLVPSGPIALPAGTPFWLWFSKPGYVGRDRLLTVEEGRTVRERLHLAPIQVLAHDLGTQVSASLFVGDLDRSGTADVLALTRQGGPVLLEQGNGRSPWRVRLRRTEGHRYWGWDGDGVPADLDGNGALDVVVPTGSFGNEFFLVAISTLDGAFLWSHPLAGPPFTPAVADLDGDGSPEVVASDGAGALRVLDGRTGTLRREIAIGAAPRAPILADLDGDGALEAVVVSGAGVLHAVDPRSGRSILRLEGVSTHGDSRPSAGDLGGDGRIELVVLGGRGLLAVDVREGRPVWERAFQARTTLLADLVPGRPGEEVVAVDFGGNLEVLDGASGDPIWTIALGGPAARAIRPAVTTWERDGKLDLTVSIGTGRVVALDGESGRILWSHDLERPVHASPVCADLDGNGVPEVFLAEASGRIVVLRPELDLAWSREGVGDVSTSAAIDPDHVLFLDHAGVLRIADLATGEFVSAGAVSAPGKQSLARRTFDLDADETPDVWLASRKGVQARSGRDGRLLWEGGPGPVSRIDAEPEDLDGDGVPDPVAVVEDRERRDWVHALCGRSGRVLWRVDLGPGTGWDDGIGDLRPVAADLDGDGSAEVLVSRRQGELTALSGRDGRVLWRKDGLAPTELDPRLSWSPAAIDWDGDGAPEAIQPSGFGFHVLSASDGSARAFVRLPGWVRSRPFPHRGPEGERWMLFLTEAGAHVLVPGTGSIVWEHRQEADSSPAETEAWRGDLTGDGSPEILLGNHDGRVVLLDGARGSVLWAVGLDRGVAGTPTVAPGSAAGRWRIVLPTGEPRVLTYDPWIGGAAGSWPFVRPGIGSPGSHALALPQLEGLRRIDALVALLPPRATSPAALAAATGRYESEAGRDAWSLLATAFHRFATGAPGGEESLDATLAAAPSLVRARILRARLHLSRGRHAEALADLEVALEPGSRTAEAYQLRGALHLRARSFGPAAADLTDALHLAAGDVRSLDILYARAQALAALGRLRDAERDLDQIVVRAKATAPVYSLRARIREQLGDLEPALADLRTALETTTDPAAREEISRAIERIERALGR